MEDELIPDWPIELFEEMCTEQQKTVARAMVDKGWMMTHLFEAATGDLAVWLITRPFKSEMSRTRAWIHAYVEVTGKIKRYVPPTAIILNVEDEE